MRHAAWISFRTAFVCALATLGCTNVSDSARQIRSGTYRLEVASASTPADGSSVAPLVATLRSPGGAPLAGVRVLLACEDGNALLLQPTISDGNGTAVGGLSAKVAGVYHVTASAVFGTQRVAFANAVDVSLLAPSEIQQASLTLRAAPDVVTADGQAAATLTVQARPRTGEDVASLAGQSVWLTSDNADDLLATPAGVLDGNGAFVTTLRSTVAGQHTIVAEANGLKAQAQLRFAAGPADRRRSRLVVEPRTCAGDGLDGLAVALTAVDAYGNPVSGAAVRLASSDGNATFEPQGGATDANGSYLATFRTTSLGRVDVTTDVNGLALAGAGNFVVGPVNVARSLLLLPATPVVADGVSLATVTVQLRDAAGHPVAGAPVSFAVPPGSDNVSFVGDSNVTDASGTLTVQFTSTAVGAVRVVASTAAGVLDSGTGAPAPGNGNAVAGSPNSVSVQATVPFVPGSPVASASALTLSANALVADGQATSTLQLLLRDAIGHPVPQTPVTLTTPVAGVRLTPSRGVTDSNGRLSAAISGIQSGPALVVATLPATSLSTSLILLPGSPNAQASRFGVTPSAVVADNTAQATATLQLRDAYSNVVPSQAVIFGLVDAGNVPVPADAAQLGAGSGTTDGTGSVQVAVRGRKAGTYAVVAQFGGQRRQASVRLLAGAANVLASHLAASPATGAVANGVDAVQLTAAVQDGYGNALPSQTVLWTSNGAGDTFDPASGQTDANGIAATTLRGTVAGSRTVTASVGGAGGIQVTTPVALVAGPAQAARSTLVLSPNAVTADGTGQATLVLRAYDAFGNAAGNVAVQLTAPAGDVLAPASGVTDAVGTYTATWRATSAGRHALSAKLGTPVVATLQANQAFVAGPAATAASSVGVSPNQLVAGSAPATLSIVLRDAQQNPVPHAAFSLTSTAGALSLGATSGESGDDGTWTGLVSATQAGPKRVEVAVGGTTLAVDFAVQPAAISPTASTLQVSPTHLAAGATSTATLRLRDAYGNAVAGSDVTFSTQPPVADGLAASSLVTAADGTATAALQRTEAGQLALQAAFTGGAFAVPVTFVAADPNATRTTLTVDPNVGIADDATSLTLSFWVRDTFGNPVAGCPVALSSDGSGDTFAPRGGATTTASDGSFVATLTSQVAQTKTLSVTCGPVTQTAQVRFVSGPIDFAHSTFGAAPDAGVAADGNTSAALSLLAADAFGNPVANANVAVVVAQPWVNLQADVGALDANGAWQAALDGNGTWTAELTSVMSGNVTVSAIFGTRALATSVQFVAAEPDAAHSSLSASPDQVVDDGTAQAQLVAHFADALGNPVVQMPVTLTASGSNANFTVASGTTDDSGAFVSAIDATVAETKTVMATVGNLTLSTNVTFLAGQPTDQTIALVAAPNALVAGSGQSSTLSFVATDRSAQPISGAAVHLVATAGNVTLANADGVTDANGTYVTTLVANALGGVEVTANLVGLHTSTQLTAVAGEANAQRSTLTAVPGLLTADGNSTATVVAMLRDAYGNRVGGTHGLFALDSGVATFSPLSGATASSGQLTTQVSSTAAQAGNVTFRTSGGLSLAAPLAFRAGPPRVATSSLVASPPSVVANNLATSQLRVQVADVFGNPVVAAPVTLSTTGSDAIFGAQAPGTPYVATTDGNGQLSVGLRGRLAGVRQVTLAVCGVQLSTPVTFLAGPADAGQSTLALAPNTSVADGNATVAAVVQLRDAYGNPVPSEAVSFALSGDGTYLSAANATTDPQGRASTTLGSFFAEPKQLTATDVNAGLSLAANVTYLAGPPSLSTSLWTADATSAVADNNQSIAYTLLARDMYGNPVPQLAVAVTTDGAGDTLAPNGGMTDAQGQFVTRLRSTVAQEKTIGAAFDGGRLQKSATFVAGPAVAATTVLTAAGAAVPADSFSPLRVTVTLADAFGNPVAGQNVTFTSSDGTDALSPPSGVSDATGQVSVDLRGQGAGSRAVTASFAATSQSANFVLVAGAPSNTTSTLVATPNTVVADGAQAVQVVLIVKDVYGNLAAGQPVVLTSTGSGQAFASAGGNTDANGVFATTLTSTVAQTKNITAALAGISLGTSVRFVAGPPAEAQSVLTAAPPQTTADGNSSASLLATFRDAYGNPCQNVTVAWGSPSVADRFASSTGPADTSGTASAALFSTVSGTRNITATAGTLALSVPVTFAAGAPDATRSSFVLSPNQLTADGSSTSLLELLIKDVQGNPVPQQMVQLAASGAFGGYTLSPSSGSTDANGRLTATFAGTAAGVRHLTASVGPTGLTGDVNLVAGAPSGATSVLLASPSQVTADGNTPMALQVVVQDAYHNPVPNQTVALNVSGANNVLSAVSGTTDAAGVWRSSLRSSKAQTKTITAQLGATAVASQVTFVPGAASAKNVQLALSPNAGVVADGKAAVQVVLTVADAQGNPIAGQAANFTVTGSANALAPNGTMTDAGGQLVATLGSTRAETKTVTAQLGNVVVHGDVSFVAGAVALSQSTLVASPNAIVADGNSSAQLAVLLADAYGNPIGGAPVTLYVSDSNNVVAPEVTVTDALGSVSGDLRSTVAQNKTVTAAFAGGTLATQVRCVPGSVDNASSGFAASPNPTTADGASLATLTVQLADAHHNAIAGQTVQFLSNAPGDVFSASQAVTDAQGQAQVTLSSTTSGLRTLTAQAQGTSFVAPLRFAPGAPSAAGSSLTVSPNLVVADNASTIQLALRAGDSLGNPTPGVVVSWSADNAPNTFGSTSTTTDDTGTAVTTLASPLAAGKTVTASVGSTSLTAPVRFVPGPPNAAQSSWQASTTQVTADGNSPITLTLSLRDAQANVVAGQNVTVVVGGDEVVATQRSGLTDAGGAFSTQVRSTKAQLTTASVWIAGIMLPAPIRFVAAAPTNQSVSLAVSPNVQAADGQGTVQLTFTVNDPYGNPIVGSPVGFSASSGNASLVPTEATTDATGVAQSQASSTQTGALSFYATVGNITAASSATFVAGSPNATQSTLGFSTDGATADGNSSTTVSVTVRDALGHPVPAQQVLLSVSDASASLTTDSLTTDASGGASTQLRTTTAGTKQVTALFAGQTVAGNVTFVAGPVSNANSTFVVQTGGNQLVANGQDTAALLFVGQDAHGNPTVGHTVSFSSSDGQATLSGGNVLCDANGTAQIGATTTLAGNRTFLATIDGTSLTGNTTFVAGEPNGSKSTLSFTATQAIADNASPIGITLVVRDAFGNTVPGRQVTLGSDGAGCTFTPSQLTTSPSGAGTSVLTSTVAQLDRITATVGAMQLGGNVTFVPGPAAAAQSTLIASAVNSGNVLVANGTDAASLIFLGQDAYGNSIAGHVVSFTSSDGQSTLTARNVTCDANGRASVAATTTVAGSRSYTATVDGTSLATNVAFVAGSPNLAFSTWTATPPNVALTTNGNLNLLLRDRYRNRVVGQPISVSTDGHNVVFTAGANATTDANGQASVLASANTVQQANFTVTSGALSLTTNVSFYASGVPTIKYSTVSANPTTLPADNLTTTSVVATLLDGGGYPVFGTQVRLKTPPTGATFTPAVATTDALGQIHSQMRSRYTGSKTVTAYLGGSAFKSVQTTFQPTTPRCNSRVVLGSVPGIALGVTGGYVFRDVVAADFNHDGAIDLAFPTFNGAGGLVVAANNGNLFFNPSFYPGGALQAVAAVDVNNDGNIDVASVGSPNALVWWKNRGNGVMDAQTEVLTAVAPMAVDGGDFNGDGFADVAVTGSGNEVVLHFGSALGFSGATHINLVAAPYAVTVADLNKDGKQDLVLTYAGANLVQVLLGGGDGSFTAAAARAGNRDASAAVGDFDGDGIADVVTAGSLRYTINYYRGLGDGTLASGITTATGDYIHLGARLVTALDYNGDGKLDVAVAGTGGAVVCRGSGHGTFTCDIAAAPGGIQNSASIAAADLDNDGHVDLVRSGTTFASVSRNLLGGAFEMTSSIAIPNLVAAQPVDVNGDGNLDLVTALGNGKAVGIQLGLGNGNFAAVSSLAAHGNVVAVATADFDGDGSLDVASAQQDTNDVSIFFATGGGNFFGAAYTPTVAQPNALVAADFDGDGTVDLAVAGTMSVGLMRGAGGGALQAPNVVALPIAPGTMAAGDFTGDGLPDLLVTGQGSLQLLVAQPNATFTLGFAYPYYGGGPVAVADIDGDGALDVTTLDNAQRYYHFFGDGAGGIRTTVQAKYQSAPVNAKWSVAPGDLDGDGIVDLVMWASRSAAVFWTRGNGDGTFASYAPYAAPGLLTVTDIRVADFNNDKRPDVLLVGPGAMLLLPQLGCR